MLVMGYVLFLHVIALPVIVLFTSIGKFWIIFLSVVSILVIFSSGLSG